MLGAAGLATRSKKPVLEATVVGDLHPALALRDKLSLATKV